MCRINGKLTKQAAPHIAVFCIVIYLDRNVEEVSCNSLRSHNMWIYQTQKDASQGSFNIIFSWSFNNGFEHSESYGKGKYSKEKTYLFTYQHIYLHMFTTCCWGQQKMNWSLPASRWVLKMSLIYNWSPDYKDTFS